MQVPIEIHLKTFLFSNTPAADGRSESRIRRNKLYSRSFSILDIFIKMPLGMNFSKTYITNGIGYLWIKRSESHTPRVLTFKLT